MTLGTRRATAVSGRCARASDGMRQNSATISADTIDMAGECGNRTHPARLGRVTPVLKTGEATRPHPPPFSVNHNRRFFPAEYFADFYRVFHF